MKKNDHSHFWLPIFVSRKGKHFRVTFACDCGKGIVREIKFIEAG